MTDLTGKVALVTGAASGIGAATVAHFLECGASVMAADIDEARLAERAAAIGAGAERLMHVRLDAADRQSADDAVRGCIDRFGALDYLVASAGIYRHQPLAQLTDEQWRAMIGVNLDGVFFICRAAVPHLRDGGAIVNIASVAAHQGGTAGNAHYGASKGGVLAFTRGLARDIAPRLRANCISPGWIETPMVADALAANGDRLVSAIPLGRAGKPREIATIAAFLCSDASSFVTGEAIIAAGGAYMG